jgi:alpha-beta hydrolase superfamily lysophospholipase
VRSWVKRLLALGLVVVAVLLTMLFGVTAWDAVRSPPLELWHTYVPRDLRADDIDGLEWAEYVRAEDSLFVAVRDNVTLKLKPDARLPFNRYFEGSPIYPGKFATDWNRSYVLEPDVPPVGAVVLLHGLTDSPYSLRFIGQHYRARGFTVIAIRLPGHGTVPAGLSHVKWQDWLAATRMAVREARRRVPAPLPLQLVGFSNGGALAMQYSLDALGDPLLARADRIVLIGPMIGITAMARFAGIAGWPSILPAFAKAAWLSITPEFNPFKYNSFPVNGAVQSHLLTRVLQRRFVEYSGASRLDSLPPVLTFQSVVDFTVSTPAIVSMLYNQLPANGSALVLFDINRNVTFGPLIRPSAESALDRLLPPAPRRYRTSVVTNAGPTEANVVDRDMAAGDTTEAVFPLALTYPRSVFSLSHLALPFPITDPMLGLEPDLSEDYGIRLGTLGLRGEVGVLVLNAESTMRLTSNPFYPYLIQRVDAWIDASGVAPAAGVH